MDSPSAIGECNTVGQTEGTGTNTEELEDESLTRKFKLASSNCTSCCGLTCKVGTSTKAQSSIARYNRDLARAFSEGVAFYKGNKGFSSSSVKVSLLLGIQPRDTFLALLSTQPFLTRIYHFSPTEFQHANSKYHKAHISVFQSLHALKDLTWDSQKQHRYVAKGYNRNHKACQKRIAYSVPEDAFNSSSPSHIIEHSSTATKSLPLQETQRNNCLPELNKPQDLRTKKTRCSSKRGSAQSYTYHHKQGLSESIPSSLPRKDSLRSHFSTASNFSGAPGHSSAFLGRHRTSSTPNLRSPQRPSFLNEQGRLRSISLYSLNRITHHRREGLFIDVRNQKVFLKPASNSPITPINVRYRVLRDEVKKIPILTPLWIIRPRHTKDLSSTGAMASPNNSYMSFEGEIPPNGRIISVADDISYYSPTTPAARPMGRGNGLGPNFEKRLASLPLPPTDHVYIGRRVPPDANHLLARALVESDSPPKKSLFKKIRDRLACLCCFGAD